VSIAWGKLGGGCALAAATVFALLLASMPNACAGGDGGQPVAPAQSVESCQQQGALRANPSAARSAIGGVALIQGRASVTRGPAARTLKVSDAIFWGDVLQTAADGTLGVTFNDATTFSLLPNSQITVDDFVYQERGKRNVAAFEVIKGTVSFVASAVAKTGDMRIDTPSAAIGIRGTAGIFEIGAASEMRIKLYPDADGHVGRIEVFGRDGSQLGVLTAGGTGFLVRAGAPAVPLQISQQEMERDRSFLRQTFSTQQTGRRINLQRQNLLRQNRQLSPSPRPGSPPKSFELVAAVQPIGRAYAIATGPCIPAAATGCARVAAVPGQYRSSGDAAGATVARFAVARAEPATGAGHSRVAGKTVSPGTSCASRVMQFHGSCWTARFRSRS
jgi:hypothetical protein